MAFLPNLVLRLIKKGISEYRAIIHRETSIAKSLPSILATFQTSLCLQQEWK